MVRAGFAGRMGPLGRRQATIGDLSAFRAAKARMAEGYRPRVLCIGDSTDVGYNIIGTGFTDASALSITKKMADLCAAEGLPANKDLAFFSQGVTGTGYQLYDPRIVQNSWTIGTSTSLAGNALRSQSPAVDALTFSPAGTVDSVTIWYISTSTAGTFTVSDGATITGTTSTMAASGVRSVTHPLASRGSGKTISINRTEANAGQVQIVGIIAFDSQVPALDIVNAGRYGTKASVEWISSGNTWSALNVITALNPDLSIISLGSNDLLGKVTPEVFSNSMQLIINACKQGGGSVALVNPAKGKQPDYGTADEQAAYTAAIRQLARTNSCAMIDEGGLFGDFVTATANGYFTDNIHPSDLGTMKRAELNARLLIDA